jgi:glycosyltransferase involved in cell wall biosynthesis
MHLTVLHHNGIAASLSNHFCQSLRQMWPDATVLVTSPAGAASSPRAPLDGSPRLPRKIPPIAAGGPEVVISTSPAAAHWAVIPQQRLHFCFVSRSAVDGTSGHTGPIHSEGRLCPEQRRLATLRTPLSALPHVHCYLAVSQTVREALAARTDRPCRVLRPPIDTSFFRPDNSRREPFYLMVHPPLAPRAYELALASCQRVRRTLVVVGALPPSTARWLRRQPHAWYAGEQPAEVVRGYYRRCRAVLFPGVADFDPTILEAQACGAPVIAYYLGGIPELILDAEHDARGTGLFFHELTTDSLVSAIEELERRPHRCEPALAWANAARFSPGQFQRTLQQWIGEWEARGSKTGPAATESTTVTGASAASESESPEFPPDRLRPAA